MNKILPKLYLGVNNSRLNICVPSVVKSSTATKLNVRILHPVRQPGHFYNKVHTLTYTIGELMRVCIH